MRKEHLLLFVACLILSLNVYAQNVGVTDDKVTRSNKYVRVTDLSQLEEGSTIVFASRHDADETSYYAMPNAHVIPRSKGGLGIEQNIVTACLECHRKMDQSSKRKTYIQIANQYLNSIYGKRENLIYQKY